MSKTKTLSKKSSYSKRDLKAYYYIRCCSGVSEVDL